MHETREACTRFLVDVFHSILRAEENYIRQAGYDNLSITEMHVIESVCLMEREGRNTAKEIARQRGITPGTLSATVKVLEKKGYVSRKRDDQDGRVVWLVPTPQGLEALRQHEIIHHRIVDEVLAPLSDTEAKTLAGALERLSNFFTDERTNAQ